MPATPRRPARRDAPFGALRADFGELRGEFRASTRHTIITIVAVAVTIWLTFYVPSVI